MLLLCRRCLSRLSSQRLLDIHMQNCKRYECQRIEMPPEGENYISFDRSQYQHKNWIVYADFECFNTPVEDDLEKKHITSRSMSRQASVWLLWMLTENCIRNR